MDEAWIKWEKVRTRVGDLLPAYPGRSRRPCEQVTSQNGKLEEPLSLAAALLQSAGDQSQMASRLLSTARTDAETALRVAAASIQTARAEVVAALIAAQQALAAQALLAVVAYGDVAALHQVQLTPIDEWCLAGEIQ